jgi:hypothetical protein
MVSCDQSLQGMRCTPYISDENEIDVAFFNGTVGTVNLTANLYITTIPAF